MSCELRVPEFDVQTLSSKQRELCDEVIGGRRGHVPAPMFAWLHSPDIAGCAQRLGEQVRYGTGLSSRLTELAILLVARRWYARYEWSAHVTHALNAGLSEEIIRSIAHKERPECFDLEEQLVFDYVEAVQNMAQISDTLHGSIVDHFGLSGAVELVCLVGYYTLVSMTLNAFRIGMSRESLIPLD